MRSARQTTGEKHEENKNRRAFRPTASIYRPERNYSASKLCPGIMSSSLGSVNPKRKVFPVKPSGGISATNRSRIRLICSSVKGFSPGNASVSGFQFLFPSDAPFLRLPRASEFGEFLARSDECVFLRIRRLRLRCLPSGFEGMQFVETMLVGLPAGYKVVFQTDHGMRQPNGIVGETFFFKDAVGLLELR